MGFLSRLFNPRSDGAPEQAAPRQNSVNNAVDATAGIIEEVIGTLSPLSLKDDFLGLRLRVADPVYKALLTDSSFEESLRLALANAQFESLATGKIEIADGTPGDGDSPLCDGKVGLSFIEAAAVAAVPVYSSAVISVVNGRGSLAEESYKLKPDSKKSVYHIGRGSVSTKDAYRVNDIIIKDDESDEAVAELNSYVSSAHADIVCRDSRFYLKATRFGCRALGGSATKLIRGDDVFELRDDRSLHLLKDGDIIELGKSVVLVFNSKEE